MAEAIVLAGETRTEFGKGASRRARREGLIPVTIYGAQQETIHAVMPGHELYLTVRDRRAEVLDIKVDGAAFKVKVAEVQRHPVSRAVLHVDLIVA